MSRSTTRAIALTVFLLAGWRATGLQSQAPAPVPDRLFQPFTYRNTGPFRMQARIAAVAVPASPLKDHLYTFYVAPWIGGVFKTTNNGTTFEPVFDAQANLSIGAIAVAP